MGIIGNKADIRTWLDLRDLYLRVAASEGDSKKGSYIDLIEQRLDVLTGLIGADTLLSGITPSDLLIIQAHLRRDMALKPATVNRYMADLSAAFSAGAKDNILERPAFPKPFVIDTEDQPHHAITREQAVLLLKKLDKSGDLGQLVRLSLNTGLRQSNARLLEWSWVDLDAMVITIPKGSFKGGTQHRLPFDEMTYQVLENQLGLDPVWVFPSPKLPGQPRSRSGCNTKAFRNAVRAAGIKGRFRWHDIRHTWATWMLEDPKNHLSTMMKLGGWKTEAMVRRYARPDEELQRRAISSVSI